MGTGTGMGMGMGMSLMTPAAAPLPTPPANKTIVGDLDSDPSIEKKLTGGANWTPKVAPTSWTSPGAPLSGATSTAPGAGPPAGAMGPPTGAQSGYGMPPAGSMMQPMMGQPMMRPPYTGMTSAPGGATTGAPISSGPAGQSPKKPKDPLAELDLKDFL
ncbi:hypothetical protein CRUP_018119 [Coryphaenoides rupestris]|nr:hypothetical protein CRUP_018119 [Coryphaenoides rupestris]